MKAVKKTAVNVGRLFVVIIAVIIALGSAIGVTALIDSISAIKTKQVITAYTIGGLDENGQHVKGNNTIYSDLFECQGLKITQAFDSADMTFQVFYYYGNEDFAESSDIIDSGYYEPESIPDDVMFARVLIIPNDMPIISWYNKYQYYSGLKIEVDIEQTVNYNNYLDDSCVSKLENYTANLTVENSVITSKINLASSVTCSIYVVDMSQLNFKVGDKFKLVYLNGNPNVEKETYRFASGEFDISNLSASNLINQSSEYLAREQNVTEVIIEVPDKVFNYLIITINNEDSVEMYREYSRGNK